MARLTPETKRFLRKAVAGLPLPKRKEAGDELRAHLEDAIQQSVAQGEEPASAEQKAVAALGNVEALNRELLRAHFGKKWLFQLLRYKLDSLLIHLHRGPAARIGLFKFVMPFTFQRQRRLGRHDEVIACAERELASRGPSYEVLSLLGWTYCDIGEHELALPHLQAEVDWLKAHSLASWMFAGGQHRAIASTYSKLAEALASLGKHDEAEAAVCAGLALDGQDFGLNFEQARYCLQRNDFEDALHHLELSLKDNSTHGEIGKAVLLILHSETFEPLRKDERFGEILRLAYEHP